jgi:hypothetical protein
VFYPSVVYLTILPNTALIYSTMNELLGKVVDENRPGLTQAKGPLSDNYRLALPVGSLNVLT